VNRAPENFREEFFSPSLFFVLKAAKIFQWWRLESANIVDVIDLLIS
jgi:hypothetical protein